MPTSGLVRSDVSSADMLLELRIISDLDRYACRVYGLTSGLVRSAVSSADMAMDTQSTPP